MRRDRQSDDPPQRIAVDTAIWLGGLLRGGPAEELVKLAITGKVRLLTSEALIADLLKVAKDRLHYSEKGVRELETLVRSCAEVVPVTPHLNGVAAGGPFPHDPVLELAALGGAALIATMHRPDLTILKDHGGIPIVEID